MKRGITNIAFVAVLAVTPALAWEDGPSLEELMKPAPNRAWNGFALAGHSTTKLADGVYAFRNTGTRSIFMVTNDGVIATDPVSETHAKLMRQAIAEVTDQPVTHVVYSHEHWDHVQGGQIFKDEGATFIAHENCVRHFYDRPNPNIVMPDVTFSDDYTLETGGRSMELMYFGTKHGDCMVVMRPDAGDFLFIVDLVTSGSAPLGFMPDYAPHHCGTHA